MFQWWILVPKHKLNQKKSGKKHKKVKKRAYNERIMNVEHSAFNSLLLLIVLESMSHEAEKF